MRLQIPEGVYSITILEICDEIEANLKTMLKQSYGPTTQTSVECRPDDPEPQIKENIFNHTADIDLVTPEVGPEGDGGGNSDNGLGGGGGFPSPFINVVTTTVFQSRSVAPFQADFDSYILNAIVADESDIIRSKGFKMETDNSTFPPTLLLAVSSGIRTSTGLGYIVCSSLTLLFLLVT